MGSLRSTPVRTAAAIFGCLGLVLWVQRHALLAFFSSPDDLIHLQQAVGLKPTLPTPLRFLSQVLYFRGMVRLFGLNPAAFHVVSLLTHLAIVLVLVRFLRVAGFANSFVLMAATLFGMMPLHVTLLSSAVGMNDELALLLALVALWLILEERPLLATAVYAVGLLCKESVLCLPLLLLWLRRPEERIGAGWRRALPLLLLALGFGLLILVLRPLGLAPGRTVYSMRVGSNVFHNLMTYTCWAVDLRNAMPDLVTSYDTSAWPVGFTVLGSLILCAWWLRQARFAILLGLAWWALGLVPVLPLRFQTYRHYLYPALPGLALAISAVAVSVAQFLSQFVGWSPGRKQVVTAVLLGICLLAYAARSESLIVARISARVTGTDLPLDPVMRRRVVAQRAIGSLAGRLGPEHARLAILSPSGLAAVYDVRTGRRAAPSDPGSQPYDLLQESLDHGGALKLFFPQIDSVAFISQWSPEHRGDVLFLSYPGGYLVGGGTGPAALESITMWMFQAGWYLQAKEYLRSVVTAYPDEPPLRLAYAGALFKLGEKEAAREQLQQILRSTPVADSAAVQARAILEAMPS